MGRPSTRNYRKAGYVRLLIKKDLAEAIDKLRVGSPMRESRPDVVRRVVEAATTSRGRVVLIPKGGVTREPKAGTLTEETEAALRQARKRPGLFSCGCGHPKDAHGLSCAEVLCSMCPPASADSRVYTTRVSRVIVGSHR